MNNKNGKENKRNEVIMTIYMRYMRMNKFHEDIYNNSDEIIYNIIGLEMENIMHIILSLQHLLHLLKSILY